MHNNVNILSATESFSLKCFNFLLCEFHPKKDKVGVEVEVREHKLISKSKLHPPPHVLSEKVL